MTKIIHVDSSEAFTFKSTRVDLVAFQPTTDNIEAITERLQEKLQHIPDFLNREPLLIDLSKIKDTSLDLAALVEILKAFKLNPVAVQHANLSQRAVAESLFLAVLPEENLSSNAKTASHQSALIIDKPVRSGQQVYAKHSDLVVLDLVSAGAEIIADGNIHVYAPLRGRALAGASGNTQARIFTMAMQAELLSIAGVYLTLDKSLPESLNNKAVQVFLQKKKLFIEALQF